MSSPDPRVRRTEAREKIQRQAEQIARLRARIVDLEGGRDRLRAALKKVLDDIGDECSCDPRSRLSACAYCTVDADAGRAALEVSDD